MKAATTAPSYDCEAFYKKSKTFLSRPSTSFTFIECFVVVEKTNIYFCLVPYVTFFFFFFFLFYVAPNDNDAVLTSKSVLFISCLLFF